MLTQLIKLTMVLFVLILVSCGSTKSSEKKSDPNTHLNDLISRNNRKQELGVVQCQYGTGSGQICPIESIPGTIYCDVHEYVRCGYIEDNRRCTHEYNKAGIDRIEDAVCFQHRSKLKYNQKLKAFNVQATDHVIVNEYSQIEK